ncbi:MAG: DUF1232 domain-containing protein [Polyangiaceae bacterium]|nr:DUF1232 domain-containing protein [Polyangiaceae bacterium]
MQSESAEAPVDEQPELTSSMPPHSAFERYTKKLGKTYIDRLKHLSSKAIRSLDRIPKRMHIVANQTQLVLELIDDFATGNYRDVPWPVVALLTGAVLYSVSPADVVPDSIPIVGAMDDILVVAIATRVARESLKKYALSKGYKIEDYFEK